jgi:hypothetical protein
MLNLAYCGRIGKQKEAVCQNNYSFFLKDILILHPEKKIVLFNFYL